MYEDFFEEYLTEATEDMKKFLLENADTGMSSSERMDSSSRKVRNLKAELVFTRSTTTSGIISRLRWSHPSCPSARPKMQSSSSLASLWMSTTRS